MAYRRAFEQRRSTALNRRSRTLGERRHSRCDETFWQRRTRAFQCAHSADECFDEAPHASAGSKNDGQKKPPSKILRDESMHCKAQVDLINVEAEQNIGLGQ
jgi:hypothetical protein